MVANKTVVVTGGARELGLTAAEALLRAGARVSIWDVDGEALERAEAELKAQGFAPDLRRVDVTDDAGVESAAQAAGAIDVLINNAALKMGFVGRADRYDREWQPHFLELDPERVRRLVEVNAVGVYYCSRAVAPGMIARRQGSIINVSTSPHTQQSARHIPYGPSKSFVESFTVAAAEQLRPQGVRMNAILPGGRANLRGKPPVGDDQPFDVMVPVTLYLASDESAGVTGQIISADSFNKR